MSVWSESPQAVGVQFEPPTTTLGIVRFRASVGGSSCEVSLNAADLTCLIQGLSAATGYAVQGVACDENDVCSIPVISSGFTLPDRECSACCLWCFTVCVYLIFLFCF